MGEDDTNGRLALSDVLGGRCAGFGILPDIPMKLFPIFPAFVLAFQLQDGDERGIGRAGASGMGHDELVLEGRVEQIIP